MAIVIGIDPSISSTGVCVWDTERNINKYFNIVKNPTKKLRALESDHIKVLGYFVDRKLKDLSNQEKEMAKTMDILHIMPKIKWILELFKPSKVVMEGIAMSAGGRIDQLAGLNYSIRQAVFQVKGCELLVLTPQTIKKSFVGDGGANKDMMVSAWRACDPNSADYESFPKNAEDLADAYAMAHFQDGNKL